MKIKILFAFILLLVSATSQTFAFEPEPPVPKGNSIIVEVQSQVNKPGKYTLPTGAVLTDALTAAGGFTRFATPSLIRLTRKTTTEKPDILRINYDRIGKGIDKDVPLQDGDIIVVSEVFF
jgi:protein involved in polysaccharide export with SLBB domain